jgi:hypothetical protein
MTTNNVPMVPSSVITVATGGECLMCDGFSLGETARLGSFEFIADYFGSLSLSPKRGDSGATFMRSTHRGTPSPGCAMIDDSIKEFLTMSSGEGGPPSPLPGGMAQRLRPLPSQPHHGWRALRALRP